jgi:hypothetical protein
MRTFLAPVAVVALALAPIFAQGAVQSMPKDRETEKYTYQEDVDVEGASANDLYDRAVTWSASAYRSVPDLIQLDDPSAGRLILKGLINVPYARITDVDVRHTVTIEVKEESYRYTITDFVVEFGAATKLMEAQWSGNQGVRTRTHERMTALIESLKKQMAQSGSVEEKTGSNAVID